MQVPKKTELDCQVIAISIVVASIAIWKDYIYVASVTKRQYSINKC